MGGRESTCFACQWHRDCLVRTSYLDPWRVSVSREIGDAFRSAKVAFFVSFAERRTTFRSRTMLKGNHYQRRGGEIRVESEMGRGSTVFSRFLIRESTNRRCINMCLAIPAQVSEVLDERQQFAMVDIMGVRRRANIELLRDDPPNVGDWVLIHVGFAMTKISAEHAEQQLKLLNSLGEVVDAADEAAGYEAGADDPAMEPRDEIR